MLDGWIKRLLSGRSRWCSQERNQYRGRKEPTKMELTEAVHFLGRRGIVHLRRNFIVYAIW
jgi:hypothetical protein